MEKVLRAASHPPQLLLIQGSHLFSLAQRCLKSQELPWRSPACCTTGRFPLAASLAVDAEPAGRPCLLWSCICPGEDSPAPPRRISCWDRRYRISLQPDPQWFNQFKVTGSPIMSARLWLWGWQWLRGQSITHPHPSPALPRACRPLPARTKPPTLRSHAVAICQSPICSFLVLFSLATRPARQQTMTGARARSFRVPAAGTAPRICTAGSLNKYLSIASGFFSFFFLLILCGLGQEGK